MVSPQASPNSLVSDFAPTTPGFSCPALRLDSASVARARSLARQAADEVQVFTATRTTVSVERTILRLLGVTGATADGQPFVNAVVDHLHAGGLLGNGVARAFLTAALHHQMTPQVLAEQVAAERIDLRRFGDGGPGGAADQRAVVALGEQLGRAGLDRILAQRHTRDRHLQQLSCGTQPLRYVIVASGNIYEDVVQARVAARQGADVIAVIRSTGQSLLDFVPEGETTEGYGGTYATQANFRLMRKALDEVGAELGRYIRLCNYASGLCMPEIACLGGFERLDMMLNDALYGILFRDINMQRTLCDQRLSRRLSALAGLIINTGEDNYLTTADAVEAAHTVVASTLINEALARSSGLVTNQLGLGHAMEVNPDLPGALTFEIAQAALLRHLFPGAPLKYMPPTKHMTGNVLRGHVQDTLFNVVGVLTGQGIQLLGMMTEAMHTPHIHDRYLALESAQMVFSGGAALGSQLQITPGGAIEARATETLAQALALLEDISAAGLRSALSRGLFADISRSPSGGRGLQGVAERNVSYWDPCEDLLQSELVRLGHLTAEGGAQWPY